MSIIGWTFVYCIPLLRFQYFNVSVWPPCGLGLVSSACSALTNSFELIGLGPDSVEAQTLECWNPPNPQAFSISRPSNPRAHGELREQPLELNRSSESIDLAMADCGAMLSQIYPQPPHRPPVPFSPGDHLPTDLHADLKTGLALSSARCVWTMATTQVALARIEVWPTFDAFAHP